MNFRLVLRILGILSIIVSSFALIPLLYDLWTGLESYWPFTYTFSFGISLGLILLTFSKREGGFGKKEGYLTVAGGWFLICLLGSLPYLFMTDGPNLINAIFESVSGFTTTGATIFEDVETLPKGILLWRSMTQWIGGMGIIVFTIALFPMLGMGGVELFFAEAPGTDNTKLHPRIKEVAKRFWFIYLGLTTLLFLLLWLVSDISIFESINHALTTMSTGGFSTRNASVAGFSNPTMEYIIGIFMIIGGTNYAVLYLLLSRRLKKALSSQEFQFYLKVLALAISMYSVYLWYNGLLEIEESFRAAFFQIVSVVTTTGFVVHDYTSISAVATAFFFFLLFFGACGGSTSGGIKMIRHLVLFKNSILEFRRILHPRAYVRIKVDHQLISGRVVTHILVFLLYYLILFMASSMILALLLPGDDALLTALGASATCLGNVGPAIGQVGPVNTFASLPDVVKPYLSFIMIVGRLEIFTILILFSSSFWLKK